MTGLENVKNKKTYLKERILWGGLLREKILVKLLLKYYNSQIYRDWNLMKQAPHFFAHRAGIFVNLYGDKNYGIHAYYRGFFVSEVIRKNDILLDIGCGDGFFTKRFYAPNCVLIDAVDIEESAIKTANYYHSDDKINYQISDAVKDPFPRLYDVIVWDGAIGHFAKSTVALILEKIKNGLLDNGIFVGSESLGKEGHDHLQYFSSLEALAELFKPFFKYVNLKSAKYELVGGYMREEAYWRCSNEKERLVNSEWKSFNL
jgi:2-polyprenyl-3-methyl-5-hydroxy-6-metoxy-1,4-benzoquinol methylase